MHLAGKESNFDEMAVTVAVRLFDQDAITTREGARMSGLTLSEFLSECSQRGVPVVRYSPAELERELANIPRVADR